MRRYLFSVAVLPVLAACGDKPGAPADTAAAATSLRDTTTLSADAVAIAGLTTDTARTIAWQSGVTVPARLMLDPAGVETIGSITEGRITHVPVRVGDAVRAGDVLVMIHSHELMDARSQLVAAKSQLTAAKSEQTLAATAAERAHRLFDAKAMSRADVERAEAAKVTADARFEQASAELDRAEAMLDHLIGKGPTPKDADDHDVLVRTPISGIVITRDAQPGTAVLPGHPLVTIGNPDRLVLQLHLTETAVQGVKVGSAIRYALTDNPSVRLDAVVTRVAPTVDTLTRTIEVLAAPTGRLRAGRAETFAQAEVLGSAGTPAVVVPVSAVQALEGDTVVIAAEPRGAGMFIEAVPVRVGRRSADRVELLAGIGVGRVVLVGGAAIAKAELLKRRTGGVAE